MLLSENVVRSAKYRVEVVSSISSKAGSVVVQLVDGVDGFVVARM